MLALACVDVRLVVVAAPIAAHEMVAIDGPARWSVLEKNPSAIEAVNISGADAQIVGIDVRPAEPRPLTAWQLEPASIYGSIPATGGR